MNTFKTVRGRLTVAFSFLTLLTLVVAGLSLKSLIDSNERFTNFVYGVNARANLAAGIRTAVDRRAIAARNLVLITDPSEIDAEKKEVLAAHADVKKHLADLKDKIAKDPDVTPDARAMVLDIDRVETAYGPVALEIVRLALERNRDSAILKINNECRPLLAALVAATEAYNQLTMAHARASALDASERFRDQRNAVLLACAIALCAAVLAGILIVRNLMQSLGAEPTRLGEVARQIAAGNLAVIDGAADARAGSVFASLGTMQGSLAAIVSNVRGASDSIATGAGEIASGNVDLSQRTEEQASALQQTAATMSELDATVRNNADNARQASQLAQGASNIAEQGGRVVDEVVMTMKGINESSKRIAEITSVIDGIAFQTNILALNAAVEAARAGDQGRGFAVVATEVRSLAQRSAAAAKDIKTLIAASVEAVGAGTSQVDRAGTTMAEIVHSIKRVSDIVGEISAASAEQSRGVGQVGEAVTQLDTVTQQNAALVEQSAAASESLKLQAVQLVEAVAIFKVSSRPLAAVHGEPRAGRAPAKPIARRVVPASSPGLATDWQTF